MKYLLLTALLLAPLCYAEEATPVFPQACQENCAVPFGAVTGTTEDGVASYSNCQAKCVYEKPSMVEKNFAGIQWQCVEFARRWLMLNKNLTYPSIDVAADLWNKVDHLVSVKTNENVPMKNHPNGASQLPHKGDLLIYGREYLETGHVAVVLSVDRAKKIVRVGEQNFLNAKWPGKYARAIPFIQFKKNYWLLDAHLIGWKSY